MTVTEAAKVLGVKSDTIYNWHRAGKLEIEFISAKRRIVKDEDVYKLRDEKVPDGMKKCKSCGYIGNCNEFGENRFTCLECYTKLEKLRYHRDKDKHREKRKEYRKANSESEKARASKWYYENREVAIEKNLLRYCENQELVAQQIRLRKYGLTEQQLSKMIEDCNNRCEICKGNFDKMCVDHCHETGKVRGLLCNKCNSGIGFLKDDVNVVTSAKNYLEKSNTDSHVNLLTSLFCNF